MANKQLTVGDVASRIQGAWHALLRGVSAKSWLTTSWDSPYYSYGSYGTNIDYTSEAGDLTHNAIVMTVIQSIMTAAPEAPPIIHRRTKEGPQVVYDHKLLTLLDKPNRYYSGRTLLQALYCSINLSGNAYWLKVRNGSGGVIELWDEPHMTIRCRWKDDGLGDVPYPDEWISHYEVYRSGKWISIAREDVVHFRFGLKGRYGMNKLSSALREVFTDNEAARYSATVLKNMGIPGVVISPKVGESIANPEDLKLAFMQKFGGDRRGEPLVSSDTLDIEVLSFSPEQMSLKDLRRLPEERIPALLQWPAVVAGLGAGLDHSTYNNMDEARQAAFEQNIIPTQVVISDTISMQLLGDLGDPQTEKVVFDLSQVRVLQEDQTNLATRWSVMVQGGIGTIAEARSALGLLQLPQEKADAVSLDPTQVRLAAQAGLLTPNEARASFGLQPIPGGDVPMLPQGMTMGGAPPPAPPPVLALPAPEKGYSVKAKARPNRRQAIERAFERDLVKLISRDIEAVAGRLAA